METPQDVSTENSLSMPDSSAQNDTAKLARKVQNLPAELFNKIWDLTFNSLAGTHCIDNDYKPPVSLQVDRSTRSALLNSYYNVSTFRTRGHLLFNWLASLPVAQIGKLHEIRTFEADVRLGYIHSCPKGRWDLMPGAHEPLRFEELVREEVELEVYLGFPMALVPPSIHRMLERARGNSQD